MNSFGFHSTLTLTSSLGQAWITSLVRRQVRESSGQLLHADYCSSNEMGDLSKQYTHQPRHRQVRRSGEEVTVSGMRPPTERDDHHELRRVDQRPDGGPRCRRHRDPRLPGQRPVDTVHHAPCRGDVEAGEEGLAIDHDVEHPLAERARPPVVDHISIR